MSKNSFYNNMIFNVYSGGEVVITNFTAGNNAKITVASGGSLTVIGNLTLGGGAELTIDGILNVNGNVTPGASSELSSCFFGMHSKRAPT